MLHALDPRPRAAVAAVAAAADAAAAASPGKLCDGRSGFGAKRGRGEGRGEGAAGESGGGLDGEDRAQRYEERCRQLLDNCVPPPWYEVPDKAAAPTVIGAVGEKMIPALTVALTRFRDNAKSLTSPKSVPTSPLGGGTTTPSAAKSSQENKTFDATAEEASSPGASLSDRSHSGRSRSRSRRSRSRSHTPTTSTMPAATAAPSPAPSSAPAPPAGTKICAVCLRKPSPAALCRRCGRRAAKAFKDDQGSRRARVLLVPYGSFFGVAEPSALQGEGDAVKRWVRLLDDEAGAHFYYNAHYDSAIWKSGIEPPKPVPVVKLARRRKGGGGGGPIVAASPPKSGRSVTPPASPPVAAPLPPRATGTAAATAATAAAAVASAGHTGRTALQKTRTMFSAASMAALHAATGGGAGSNAPGGGGGDGPRTTTPTIKPALKLSAPPSSPQRKIVAGPSSPGNRVVLLTAGDDEVVLDAHKRIYPPFRLISWEEAAAAAAAAAAGAVTPGGMEGVTPGPGGGLGLGRKSYSRGGSAATPVDSARERPRSVSRAGTVKRAGTILARAGTTSAAGATAAAAT